MPPVPAPRRPDEPHLHLVEAPPQGDQRLQAVHDTREHVAGVTGMSLVESEALHEAAQKAVREIDVAENFAKSPLLQWVVTNFLKIDDQTFEQDRATIVKEVTQALTIDEVPQVRLLLDWCAKHQKTYAELMGKIRQAFQVYQKRLAREAESVAKETPGPSAIMLDQFLTSNEATSILDQFLDPSIDANTRREIMNDFFRYFLTLDKSAPTLWKLAQEHPKLRVGDLTKAMKVAFDEYRGKEKRAA